MGRPIVEGDSKVTLWLVPLARWMAYSAKSSFNVQRSYRDGDETHFVSSFGLAELSQAIRVLQLAQEHVEKAEANGAT